MLKAFSFLLAAALFVSANSARADICSRSPEIQEYISSNLQKYVSCHDITDADLASLKNLSATATDVSVLKSGDLDGLFNLERLNLMGSGLTQIPADLFRDLRKLTDLELNINQLTYLPAGLLDSTPLLEILKIEGNNIERPTPGLFANLKFLKYFSFDRNSVDLQEIKNLRALEYIEMWYDGKDPLFEDMFQGLPHLQTIRMFAENGSAKVLLPRKLFRGLSKIHEIFICHPAYENLDEQQFLGLSSLENLTICLTGIKDLPPNLFRPLVSLKKLFLAGDQFATWPAHLLDANVNLEELTVEDTPAIAKHLDFLKSLTKLKYLDLSWNGIVNLPEGVFRGLPLDELRLNDNGLVDISTLVFNEDNFSPTAKVYFHRNPLSAQTKYNLQQQLGHRALFKPPGTP